MAYSASEPTFPLFLRHHNDPVICIPSSCHTIVAYWLTANREFTGQTSQQPVGNPAIRVLSDHTRRPRTSRRLLALGLFATSAALAVCVAEAVVCLQTQATERPDCFGNSPVHVRRLVESADSEDLLFYVVDGAEDSLETLETLLRIVLPEEPDFVVVMGGFPGGGRAALSQFLFHEIAALSVQCPVFVVPREAGAGWDAGTCGPAQFHFRLGNRLFLFGRQPVGAALRAETQPGDDVFVFAPASAGEAREPGHDAQATGAAIRYMFLGGRRGYWKGAGNGAAGLAHVGDDADLTGADGRLRPVARVAVEGKMMADTMLAVELGNGMWRQLRRSIVVHIWPLVMHSVAFCVLAAVVLTALVLLTAWQIKGWRSAAAGATPSHGEMGDG